MWLFIKLDEIYDLRLADDKNFITRILPRVSGSLLNFLGSCLRANNSWAECKSRLLQEYFPHFIRERLVWDLIIFNFQAEGQSFRAYVEQISGAARFLQYEASESELVDRVLMNFHPSVIAHVAFVDKPSSLKELRVVGLIEEKSAVANERRRVELDARPLGVNPSSVRVVPRSTPARVAARQNVVTKCWDCGSPGHFRRNCPGRSALLGNGQVPGGRQAPGERS